MAKPHVAMTPGCEDIPWKPLDIISKQTVVIGSVITPECLQELLLWWVWCTSSVPSVNAFLSCAKCDMNVCYRCYFEILRFQPEYVRSMGQWVIRPRFLHNLRVLGNFWPILGLRGMDWYKARMLSRWLFVKNYYVQFSSILGVLSDSDSKNKCVSSMTHLTTKMHGSHMYTHAQC